MAVKKVSELTEIDIDSFTGDNNSLSSKIYFLVTNESGISQLEYTSNRVNLTSINDIIRINYID